MKYLAVIVTLTACSAGAQEAAFSLDATETCLNGAENFSEKRVCIGKSAEACTKRVSEGATLIGGVGRCYSKEGQYWEKRLADTYATGLTQAKANNTQPAGLEALVPPKSDAYREMQTAWVSFREARCRFEGNYVVSVIPAVHVCLLQVTAEQTLYLEDIQARF